MSSRRANPSELATQCRLPNVYPFRRVSEGLASYWPYAIDDYARAAAYVDCILKGEKACQSAGADADQI
jgi:hypothetical protein